MKWVSLISGLLLALTISFVAGMWAVQRGSPPAELFASAKAFFRAYRDTGHLIPQTAYLRRPNSVPAQRYSVYDADRMSPGALFVARYEADGNSTVGELIAPDGGVLHRWDLSYTEHVNPDAQDIPVHDAQVLPDGSVVASFDDFEGLIRVDTCSRLVWARDDAFYHHAFSIAEDKSLWIWRAEDNDVSARQSIVQIDLANGEILAQIDLIEDVIGDSSELRHLFRLPSTYEFAANNGVDIFHPNDVEVLSADMADAFPDLAPGDLLISLREPALLAVLDPEGHGVKWFQHGPWHGQHDPDFEPDGTITVFSNNRRRQQSEVLVVSFPDGEVAPLPVERQFYSDIMGQQQRAANGNRLVVSARHGRAVEFAPDGAALREYVNLLGDDFVAILTAAQIIPPGSVDMDPVSCSQD